MLYLLMGVALIWEIYEYQRSEDYHLRRLKAGQRRVGYRILRLLEAFRWFCSRKAKDDIDLIVADLRRDIRSMRREGRSNRFIRFALLWRVIFGAILPTIWAALRGLLPIIKRL